LEQPPDHQPNRGLVEQNGVGYSSPSSPPIHSTFGQRRPIEHGVEAQPQKSKEQKERMGATGGVMKETLEDGRGGHSQNEEPGGTRIELKYHLGRDGKHDKRHHCDSHRTIDQACKAGLVDREAVEGRTEDQRGNTEDKEEHGQAE
jgi:hypothetical protein